MKKFRKILAFILALVMVLSLAACAANEEPQAEPTQGEQQPAGEQTPQATQPQGTAGRKAGCYRYDDHG